MALADLHCEFGEVTSSIRETRLQRLAMGRCGTSFYCIIFYLGELLSEFGHEGQLRDPRDLDETCNYATVTHPPPSLLRPVVVCGGIASLVPGGQRSPIVTLSFAVAGLTTAYS